MTSYATRTSPVLRGKWILTNILGTPPPPPPPNVPTLKDNTIGVELLSVRERLAEHRANPACASCHKLMDPAGLRARELRRRRPLAGDSRRACPSTPPAACPTARRFDGAAGSKQPCCSVPNCSSRTLTGEAAHLRPRAGASSPTTCPAVRKIVRDAAAERLPLLVADRGDRQAARRFR